VLRSSGWFSVSTNRQSLGDVAGSIDERFAQLIVALIAQRLIDSGGLNFIPDHQDRPCFDAKFALAAFGLDGAITTNLGQTLHGFRSPDPFDFEPHNITPVSGRFGTTNAGSVGHEQSNYGCSYRSIRPITLGFLEPCRNPPKKSEESNVSPGDTGNHA